MSSLTLNVGLGFISRAVERRTLKAAIAEEWETEDWCGE